MHVKIKTLSIIIALFMAVLCLTPVSAQAAVSAPALKSASAGYHSITVSWTAVKNASGYQIWYKRADAKENITTVGNVTKKTLSDLKGGKKYTVKVRSFQKKNGVKVYSEWSKTKSATTCNTNWTKLKQKYTNDSSVNQLIFVQYTGGSNATLFLYTKTPERTWKGALKCSAYVGQNGINKQKEGDRKTPTGTFDITCAFGNSPDPGALMDYTKINKNLYWCGDKYYNTMVDIKKKPHNCIGEHLINYTTAYAYSMNIGYNLECVKGKGSAIFLHCFGSNPYTLGCVAVSKENMVKLLKTCDYGTKICIYRR